jgi:glutaredoxin
MLVEIYTKTQCGHCTRAKLLLQDKGIPYKEYMIGVDIMGEQVKAKYPTAKTVPVVVVNGEYIGGADQLTIKINEEGENFGKNFIQD